MNRPLALDLFCGAGGASMGLYRAGFEVVGVDNRPQPRYPFTFIQADALKPPVDFRRFDFIWASPPCQGYTTMNNRRPSRMPRLIAETRRMLEWCGVPYCIENVEGAASHMRRSFRLCGSSFALGTRRHRLFECSTLILAPRCCHGVRNVPVYGKLDGRRLWARRDGSELRAPKTLGEASEAMGIDWMQWDELRESIPPAYSEFIGREFLKQRKVVA